MIQEEKRARTPLEVLRIVEELLVKRATRIEVCRLTPDVWKIVGRSF